MIWRSHQNRVRVGIANEQRTSLSAYPGRYPLIAELVRSNLKAAVRGSGAHVRLGSTIEFREEELLLLRSGYV